MVSRQMYDISGNININKFLQNIDFISSLDNSLSKVKSACMYSFLMIYIWDTCLLFCYPILGKCIEFLSYFTLNKCQRPKYIQCCVVILMSKPIMCLVIIDAKIEYAIIHSTLQSPNLGVNFIYHVVLN
jgi:hypothetical protein